ncbi:hypothetical protein SESBI_31505 [Sesbania bispinosa]|nr:hypothetical protein SESBI_31505 [Sesbania bispinosa]
MRVGFEVLHANPNMIRPHMHETWDYPNIADLQAPIPTPSNQYPKPPTENHYLNLGQNEVCDWVEHISKHLVEDIPETTSDNNNLLANTPITRASHDNLVPSLLSPNFNPRKSSFTNDPLNSNNFNPHIQSNTLDFDHNNNNVYDHGLNLITLLMECAVAISVDNLGEAHRMLLEITQVASPYKPSCAERVVAYFAKAMTSRGLQWPPFFHILATRMEGPPEVRMTGMGTSMELLVETGKQLSNFARRLGLSFKFNPVATKFGEIDVSMVQVRHGETLAVHWLQHSLYDATGPDWKTLRLLEELEPKIITLVEQDVNHGGSFLDRFVGSLHYYSTLFDSLGAYLHSDDSSRQSVEHGLLSKEINNILAIGGPARSGEDKFRQWRSELARHCFVQVPMSANSMAQAQLILNMFSPAHGYSLAQVDGTLRLGWKDTSLYTASAWTSSTSR